MAGRPILQIVLLHLFRFFRQKRLKKIRSARSSVTRKKLQNIHMVNTQWINTICASMLVVFVYGLLKEWQVWIFYKPNQSYWERAHVHWNDHMWVEHLRMRKETFNFICNELRPRLSKKTYSFPKANFCGSKSCNGFVAIGNGY